MRVTLHDGSRVVIRPIEVSDSAALAAGHERLSAHSQYQRYLSSKPRLSERELGYLTDIDHRDHEALIAIDPLSGDSVVGVARYVRSAPEVAEPAIVIADHWQGRGLAGRLLDALVQRAREEGIRRFEAPVLTGNHEAIRVLGRLGETTERQFGNEVQLEIELAPGPSSGVRVRALLERFATDTPGAARTLLELLSPRQGAPRRARLRNRIVVATDGAQSAAPAIRATIMLATASSADAHVVGAPDSPRVVDALRALRGRGITAQAHESRGTPADFLAGVAADQAARLVVLSGGDRTGATALAAHVASRSACDVLIIHTPQDTVAGP